MATSKVPGGSFFDKYISFLKRFKWLIIVMWLVALGVGLLFFQKFMHHTTSQFEPPSSSLAHKASTAYGKQFPGQSKMSTVLIVVQRKDGQSTTDLKTNQNLMDFIMTLHEKISSLSPVPTMSYYWKFSNQSLFTLADTFVSNNVTLIDLSLDNTDNKLANKNLVKILDDVHSLRAQPSLSDYKIQVTGELVFYKDVREGADKDLARVDGITLPIALIVLAFVLRSLRLVLMPLLSIGVSVLTSFSIMYPISFAIDVVSVTPSLMMSTTIALSIDYSLFLFSRFMEEIRSGHEAVAAMETSLRMAGETIFVSGTTLCICFLGLTLLPLTLLQTMGLGAGCAVLCAMCNSLNLVPALVFAFPKFFGNADQNDIKNLFLKITSCCRKSRGDAEAFRLAPMPSSVPRDVRYELNHSRWFRWTQLTIKYRIPVFLVLLASMVPFLWQALLMQTSSQVTLTVPRNVESVAAYDIIGDKFSEGALMPYFLVLVARSGSHALDPSFFNSSLALLKRMETVPNTDLGQFTGILVFNSTYVSYDKWVQAMTKPESEFDKTLRALTGPLGFVNNNNHTLATAQKVEIVLKIDPSSPDGKSWLKGQRDVLKEKDWGIDVYLSNGASMEIDGIDIVYQFLPIQFAVTAGVVFLLMLFAFRSLVVPLRSIFSIALTLSWTYGIAKLVYNDGILGWLSWNAVAKYDGVSWFTPVMCFSILTGFGLDYDIFLLTRIAEYRSLGFTDNASISLAVHKTGGIITAAGCIMAIAFGGLLFSTMPLLNMCSFFIVLSVLFDTFVVRTIMVPALMAMIGRFNFWPRTLPEGHKDVWDMPVESAEAPGAGLD